MTAVMTRVESIVILRRLEVGPSFLWRNITVDVKCQINSSNFTLLLLFVTVLHLMSCNHMNMVQEKRSDHHGLHFLKKYPRLLFLTTYSSVTAIIIIIIIIGCAALGGPWPPQQSLSVLANLIPLSLLVWSAIWAPLHKVCIIWIWYVGRFHPFTGHEGPKGE